MKKLILLIAFIAIYPLSAQIRELKFEFEGCNTSDAQNTIRKRLLKIPGISSSIRTLSTTPNYVISLSWRPDVTFVANSFYEAFETGDFPLTSIFMVIDGDLQSSDKGLLLTSTPDKSEFIVDAEQEDLIREESHDLTRFQRCHIKANVLNVRARNFLDVAECRLY